MDMLTDPEMKEVVEEFAEESAQIFSQLEDILDDLEDDPTDSKKLEEFGQLIDRVMGAAKSLGAEKIGVMCELGKIIGYKSSQKMDDALRDIVIAIMFDTVDILNKMISNVKTGKGESLDELNTEKFVSRLRWLSDKFKDIERASVSFNEEEKTQDTSGKTDKGQMDQGNIDNLLEDLGL